MSESEASKVSFFRLIARPFIAGLLAVFPLVLTAAIIIWLVDFLYGFLGPDSFLGKGIESIGLTFVSEETLGYLIGAGLVLVMIYLLGVLVEAGMKRRWNLLVDSVIRRVPLVRTIYNASQQLTGMFTRKDQAELKAMSPVMCYFGGEGGTGVLALMPSPEKIHINGHDYNAVLVPSAPVPFGGGLLYVPVDWVRPVDFGVDGLLDVYMSMGVSSSAYLDGRIIEPGETGDSEE